MSNATPHSLSDLRAAFGKITIGESGAAVAEKAKTVSIDTLPEGHSKETLKAGQAHRDLLVAAGTSALEAPAYEYFKQNPTAQEVNLKFPYGSDSVAIRIKREKDIRNVQTGAVSKVQGSVGIAFKVSARPNRGELKKVCDDIKTKFAGLAD